MAHFEMPTAFGVEVTWPGGQGKFQQVSGLTTEEHVDEVSEGGENRFVHKLPPPRKRTNLVCRRGVVKGADWLIRVLEGDLTTAVEPADITVTLLKSTAKALIRWHIQRAWPVKWEAEPMRPGIGEIAIERLEFSYHAITRDAGIHGP